MQSKNAVYQYSTNLNSLQEGQLDVTLKYSGKIKDSMYFLLPKMVPGIYDALNYGKYISNLTCRTSKGKEIPVKRMDENTWLITNPSKGIELQYTVKEGWSNYNFENMRPYVSSENKIGNSVILLNANATFGYFKNEENKYFDIQVKRPTHFYGATSLPKTNGETFDVYHAQNYRQLVDNPILFSRPDTASIVLPNIKVNVVSYSTSQEPISKILRDYIQPLIINQSDYLRGQLPTDYYTFLVYHEENPNFNEGYVAEGLEHNQSTVLIIYSPMDMEILKENIFNLASHEFFHTMIPLGLHSQEIGSFDFHQPKLSKHLWLYEGTTEYFTIHMPIYQHLTIEPDFAKTVERKIATMNKFNDTIPFTTLSKNVLDYSDEYMNVYAKGALINLCLDILIRENTVGEKGLVDLILDLQKIYGKHKPFQDDQLFNDINDWAKSAEIKQFIELHINGKMPLPLKNILLKVGWEYDEKIQSIQIIDQPSMQQRKLNETWLNKKP